MSDKLYNSCTDVVRTIPGKVVSIYTDFMQTIFLNASNVVRRQKCGKRTCRNPGHLQIMMFTVFRAAIACFIVQVSFPRAKIVRRCFCAVLKPKKAEDFRSKHPLAKLNYERCTRSSKSVAKIVSRIAIHVLSSINLSQIKRSE